MNNWSFWVELVARSSVLLLAGEGLRWVIRSQPARFRHRLAVWVLLLLALLPVFALVLPDIHIPLPNLTRSTNAFVSVQEISARAYAVPPRRQPDLLILIWAAGALVALTPLLAGVVSVHTVARRAIPFPRFAHAAFEPETKVLLSIDVLLPITCGIFNPVILLPAGAEGWSESRLEAVLLHETAHVRRHDVATQAAAHILAAVWWFQPLVWLLRRRLRTESELECDAEALRSGFRPSDYASELLAIAKLVGSDKAAAAAYSISMARPAGLEQRLRAILIPRPASFSPTKMFSVVTALALAAAAASAVSVNSDRSFSEQGGSIMKRTLITGLLNSAGLSAAIVSGSIHDAGGNAVAGATISVLNPDTGAKQLATSDADGKFNIGGAGAGQYILRIEKSGYASLFREFDLKADSNAEREFTLTNEGAQPVADQVGPEATDQSKPIHVGGMVAESNLIKKVQPTYPFAAKADRIQGTVQIEATISKDGVPSELRVVSSPSPDLSESSLEAVRQWRYRPTLLNGEPAEIVTVVMVHYTLSQ